MSVRFQLEFSRRFELSIKTPLKSLTIPALGLNFTTIATRKAMIMNYSSSTLVGHMKKSFGLSLLALLALTIPAAAEPFATANVVKTIYSFKGGADGSTPIFGLTIGPKNELYGATLYTVFQLKEKSNGTWSETPIVATTYATQIQSLIGTSTALYGVSGVGTDQPCKRNAEGCGEVVELTPPTTGTVWKRKAIYKFQGGGDGQLPAGIAIAPNGDIYGTTTEGGNAPACGSDNGINTGCGTLFRLAYDKDKKTWTEKVLHVFKSGSDGAMPFTAPSFDAAGNVYGSTNEGGGGSSDSNSAHASVKGSCDGLGTVYYLDEILRVMWLNFCDEAGPAYANAIVTTLINGELGAQTVNAGFSSANAAAAPKAANGAIFTTQGGGIDSKACAPLGNNGCGVVAELTEPASGKAPWKLKTLHNFKFTDGEEPGGNLVDHGKNALYGVATFGGSNSSACQKETFHQFGCGVLYELVRKSSDWAWGGAVYKFPGGSHGALPNGELLSYKGKIYGMTADGGSTACGNAGCGTIFQLTP